MSNDEIASKTGKSVAGRRRRIAPKPNAATLSLSIPTELSHDFDDWLRQGWLSRPEAAEKLIAIAQALRATARKGRKR
jgi:hypothetical protein